MTSVPPIRDGESFGSYLRRTRRGHYDESQTTAAERLGLQQHIVSRIERGDAPPPESITALAKYLGLPVKELRELIERERLLKEHRAAQRRLAEVEAKLGRAGIMKFK